MTQCSSRSVTCAAAVPRTTGATARGRVRRRAAPIQSPTVTGPASITGRLAGLPLVRFFLVRDATVGSLLARPIRAVRNQILHETPPPRWFFVRDVVSRQADAATAAEYAESVTDQPARALYPQANSVEDFAHNLADVRANIAAAAERAGRDADDIRLLSVSK